jgi:DNA-binding HxlR family transcriptional regulator
MRSAIREHSEMAAKSSGGTTRVRISAEPSYLARLGVVWAYPLRLTIVTELYMREMSVTEFFEKFGGGSKGNVRWHFQKLVEHGWLRKVRRKKGPRGRPQQLYRATELAYYDDDCAAELPLSVRAAFSTRILQQMGERVACAAQAGTIASRDDRFFALETFAVDERGWAEAKKILADCFRSLAQEQTDAKVRLASADLPPMLMMVAIAGFGPPQPPAGKLERWLESREEEVPRMDLDNGMPLETRMAKVFGDPVNLTIVRELNTTAMSPTQLEKCIPGTTVQQLDKKLKRLKKYGWVARVDDKTGGSRRGSTEVFYRATSPLVTADLWPQMPASTYPDPGREKLDEFHKKALEAMRAGTLDARHDRHLTWSALLLDDLGCQQVSAALGSCQKSLRHVANCAGRRLASASKNARGASTRGASTTFFLAAFEIPPLDSILA